jgi:hypothetical protein
MSFKTSMSGSLCLRFVRNVNVGLTVPLSHLKHLLWVRCILRRRWSCCTFVAFKTWGSLAFVLFIMQVLGFMLHTLALGSLCPRVIRCVSFGFFLPMLLTPSRRPICQVYALLMFLRWGRFWLLRRVESGGELAWVCRRQEICGSSINWAVPCVVWCNTLLLHFTLCRIAVRLVFQLYTMSSLSTGGTPCHLALWLLFGLWLSLLSFGCWVIVWSAFGGSLCRLAILIVVWGIIVGVGLKGGQWG